MNDSLTGDVKKCAAHDQKAATLLLIAVIQRADSRLRLITKCFRPSKENCSSFDWKRRCFAAFILGCAPTIVGEGHSVFFGFAARGVVSASTPSVDQASQLGFAAPVG